MVASLKDKNVKKLKKLVRKFILLIFFLKYKSLEGNYFVISTKNLFNEYKPDVVINFTIKPIIYSSLLLKTKKVKVINTLDGLT